VQCGQGALPGLVALLKRYVPFMGPPNPGASVVRRAADAITNLAHENVSIKSRVRTEGGIPPLVALLESYDAKVGPHSPSLAPHMLLALPARQRHGHFVCRHLLCMHTDGCKGFAAVMRHGGSWGPHAMANGLAHLCVPGMSAAPGALHTEEGEKSAPAGA
jgi:hypothetical protein